MMIHEKILAVMADSEAIAKDRRNATQGFNFRGIDDVYNALHPLLAKHGVFSTTEVVEERSEERITAHGGTLIYRILKVRFHFYAADGSTVESTMIGEGMDSGDKASNKAMAVAHKYALLQLLAIPTEDAKDPDAESHEVAPRSERDKRPTTSGYVTPPAANTLPPAVGPAKAQCIALVAELHISKEVFRGMYDANGRDWGKTLAELEDRKQKIAEMAARGMPEFDEPPFEAERKNA